MKAQNQTIAKEHNRNYILELLIKKAPISRIELSKLTGLSKMTVSNIIGELINDGLVSEIGSEETNIGRKPIALEINQNSVFFLGLYISRNIIHAVAGNLAGNIVAEKKVKTPHDKNELINTVISLLDSIRALVPTDKIHSVGISSIGPLDRKSGVILNPPNFYGIENTNIAEILNKRYKCPIYIDKDTNASALAEWLFGKAKSISDYIYVGVTNGIGAAIMSDDRLYRGEDGFGGELGHITVDINGERCSCGNIGCLEMYASIKEYNSFDLKKSCKYLSAGLVTLINLFDPSVIYLGHDIAREGDIAADILQKELACRYISRNKKTINVEISAFGELAPVYGAFAVAVCGFLGK